MTRNHISLIGSFFCCHYFEKAYLPLLTLVYIFALLRYHVDNEMNQGRPPPPGKKIEKNSLSVCSWNVDSLISHDFSKVTHLKTYILTYNSPIPDSLLEIKDII